MESSAVAMGHQAETASSKAARHEQPLQAIQADALRPTLSAAANTTKTPLRRGQRLGMAAALTTVAIGVSSAAYAVYERADCSAPSNETIEEARALLDAPTNEVQHMLQAKMTTDQTQAKTAAERFAHMAANKAAIYSAQQKIASAYRLTTQDYRHYAGNLEKELYVDPAAPTPVSIYMAAAREQLAVTGQSLRFAGSDEKMAGGFRGLTDAQKESAITKRNILEIMQHAGSQPIEFRKEGGVKEYVLAYSEPQASQDDSNPGGITYVEGYHLNGVIYLDSSTSIRSSTLRHEDAHAHDSSMCKSIGSISPDDDAFASLNESQAYTPRIGDRHYKDTLHDSTEIAPATPRPLYASSYAQKELIEDKAETAQLLTAIDSGELEVNIADVPRSSILGKKLDFIMARYIESSEVNRKSMHYFAALNGLAPTQ